MDRRWLIQFAAFVVLIVTAVSASAQTSAPAKEANHASVCVERALVGSPVVSVHLRGTPRPRPDAEGRMPPSPDWRVANSRGQTIASGEFDGYLPENWGSLNLCSADFRMSFLSIGKYEAVVTRKGAGAAGIIARTTFTYLPIFDLVFVLAAGLGIVILGLHLIGDFRAHPAWWLIAPFALGLALQIFLPWEFLRRSHPWTMPLFAQLWAISAVVGYAEAFPPRNRWKLSLQGFAVAVAVTIAALCTEGLGPFPLACVAGDGQCAVVAYLPVGVAILLQRNSLGLLRFCVKAFVTWLVIWSALFFMLLLHWDSRYQRFGELFGTLPLHAAAFGTFSLGFVTFIACSRWHRERLEEAMGSGK